MREARSWQEGRFSLHTDLLLEATGTCPDKLTPAEPKQSSPSRKISKRKNASSSFFLIKYLPSPESQKNPSLQGCYRRDLSQHAPNTELTLPGTAACTTSLSS